MTQTPASGPFLLVTTPPMSSASICTAAGSGCASGRAMSQVDNSTDTQPTTMLEDSRLLILMAVSSTLGRAALDDPCHSEACTGYKISPKRDDHSRTARHGTGSLDSHGHGASEAGEERCTGGDRSREDERCRPEPRHQAD